MRRGIFSYGGKKKRRRGGLFLLACLAFVIVGVSLYTVMDNGKIDFVRHYVTVSDLPESLEGFTVLMISDLAGGTFGSKQRVLAEAAKKASYNAIVVNGDFTDKNGRADALVQLIAALNTTKPIFLIPGDGDPPYNPNAPADPYTAAVSAGAIWLDSSRSVTVRNAQVWFVPEHQLIENNPTTQLELYNNEIANLIKRSSTDEGGRQYAIAQHEIAALGREIEARETIKTDDLQIVVMHNPLDEARAALITSFSVSGDSFYTGIDAFLAGHYAGGSWRLPWLSAIYVNGHGFFPKDGEIYGKNAVLGWTQIISGGLGPASDSPFPAFRLFNTPEITYVTFTRYLQ
ncbi:MAG: metallophosphoesterase [Oscillospiraceae bacterium]|jgi:predicted MPP superfamily phosphohydrolase|nr:metallophosphoesterase [Oscillospiraceae bacterium]